VCFLRVFSEKHDFFSLRHLWFSCAWRTRFFACFFTFFACFCKVRRKHEKGLKWLKYPFFPYDISAKNPQK
jgi:hypothetical protein